MFVASSLKVTATDGTSFVYSPAAVQHVHFAAPSGGVSPYNPPRITQVVVYDATGSATTITVAQYNGSNSLYELGYFSSDGIWSTQLSNR